MFIPHNGRIVILDDKLEQALPLIKTLSKDKIPFTYHNGEQNQLPLTPYDDVRIIFIDINLTDGANEETIKSQLQNTITQLIKPNTTYIAAIWSLKENEYDTLLNDLFNNKIPNLKPLLRISLSKNELFIIDPESGNYVEDPAKNIIKSINDKLSFELQKSQSFKALIKWENIISECLSETIYQYTNIIERDEKWNDNLRHIFYKMAHAQLGKNIKNATEKQILQATLKTLNSSFIEKIEDKLSISTIIPDDISIKSKGIFFYKHINGSDIKLKWEDLKTHVFYLNGTEKSRNKHVDKLKIGNAAEQQILDAFKIIYNKISPQLNSELLLNKNSNPLLHPGNLYFKSTTGSKKRKLLKTYFKNINKKTNNIFDIQDISRFKFVELECTPICDYSQKKWLRSRILPGIMYPANSHNMLDTELDSIYTEIPPFYFDGIIQRIVFDYRLFKSINLEDDTNSPKTFLFKLKNEVLFDIQARISSHVNRPGITTIS